MELGAAPQRTAALEPLSLLNSAAPESLSGQSDGDSVGAIRGGAVEPLPSNEQEQEEVFPMGWGAEQRGQAVKPPRSSGPPPADSSFKGGVAAAAAPDRMRLSGAGDVGDSGASDVAVVQNQPSGSAIVIEGPTSLTPYGLSAKAPGSFGAQRLKRELRQAASGELATPLASAGAGDVGAECDATPLQSRPPRDNSSGSQGGGGGSFSLAALLGASGIGRVETASEGAGSTSASGLEECSSNGEGRGMLKRKDTITWESFLAGMSVGSGTEEGGGAAKEASASDSSSPAESRLPPEASMERPEAEGHPRPGAGAEQPSTVRTRYLRAMASNAGAVPWNNNTDDDDDGDDESGDTTDGGGGFRGLPELSEGHAMNTAHIPRLLSDLSDRTFSPRSRHLDLGRSQSLSSVGLGSINNVRKTMERGINKFNVNPKDGIAFLIENGLMTDTAEQICDFLSTAEGLSKRRIGEYFGRDNPKVQEVLRLFLRKLNFKDASLDEALRSMVVRFRLPGEAQQMDRIMESFAVRYHEENPGVFSCSDTAWVLAFGLMMLNTDMYNRNIKESDKMTEAQFVKNHRGIDKGQDPPKELLEGMYRRIKASEIRMDEGDMYESEVITFVAPKKSGWLKKKSTGYVGKWKRHWFVLNDAVLYYFIAPQHQDEAPRCIIPLEGINISPVGATDLSIGLRTNQGYVKSVKMADNGIMQQGQHRSFVLRAESMAERDIWVEALRAEVPAFHMELSTTRSLSATPATSSAPTPVGTPSESGRRTSKFGASGRDRRRRATVDVDASSQMPRPVIRGWARTQSDQHQSGSRRYIALFRNVGPNLQDNVIYFFGDTAMCDKMIGQQLRTSHGCLTLSDVTRLQVGEEQGSGGGKAIALYTGTGKNVKEMIIVPEEQREFLSWTRLIKECCPDSAYSVAADGVPIMSSIGDALFTSVADSERDGLASSASRPVSIADQGSMHNGQEGVFLATGIPSTVEGAAGTADNKGREDSVGSDVYVRSESSVTQPVGVGGGDSRGQREMGRMITTASSVTEADHPTEPEEVGGDRDGDPRSPTGPRPTLTARESSTPGTDVE